MAEWQTYTTTYSSMVARAESFDVIGPDGTSHKVILYGRLEETIGSDVDLAVTITLVGASEEFAMAAAEKLYAVVRESWLEVER